MKRTVTAFALVAAVSTTAACSLENTGASDDTVRVVVGYQSKTINTVTAGTLLRAQGYLEQRLQTITDSTGVEYTVEWQDYDTGAPITAQMVAEKIDIGSMGDYPMLINGSRTQANPNAANRDRLGHRIQPQGRPQYGGRATGFARDEASPTWPGRRSRPASGLRVTAPWSRRSTRPESIRTPMSRSSTSSPRSAPRRSNPDRWRRCRSSSPGPGCWCSRTRRSCCTTEQS